MHRLCVCARVLSCVQFFVTIDSEGKCLPCSSNFAPEDFVICVSESVPES